MSLPTDISARHNKVAKKITNNSLTNKEKLQIAKEIDQFARLLIDIYRQQKTKL